MRAISLPSVNAFNHHSSLQVENQQHLEASTARVLGVFVIYMYSLLFKTYFILETGDNVTEGGPIIGSGDPGSLD